MIYNNHYDLINYCCYYKDHYWQYYGNQIIINNRQL